MQFFYLLTINSPASAGLGWLLRYSGFLAILLIVLLQVWRSGKMLRRLKLKTHEGITPNYAKESQRSKGRTIKGKGWSMFAPVLFCFVFGLGIVAGRYLVPDSHRYVFYGVYLDKVLSKDAWNLNSPQTGPFRADFCPSNHVEQYKPKAGYVLCRLQYLDRGCLDISGKHEGITWVKDKDSWTTTLTENDTFQPWPKCTKDEPTAQNAREGN